MTPTQEGIFDLAHQIHNLAYERMQVIEDQRYSKVDASRTLEWIQLHQAMKLAGLITDTVYDVPNAIDREYGTLPYIDANNGKTISVQTDADGMISAWTAQIDGDGQLHP